MNNNTAFKKPAPRSKTPEPNTRRTREDVTCATASQTAIRLGQRQPSSLSRGAKSENDVRRTTKPKSETLSKQDMLALSYNAYLESTLMAMHDAEIRERKEREVVNIMENQQLELMALEEENNYLDMVLMKIELFKEIKEKMEKKIEMCKQIVGSIDEVELDNQIRTVEDDITKLCLRNFKLPETIEDRNAVMELFKNISESLDVVPEIKSMVEPLNKMESSLVRAEELNEAVEKSMKECHKKLKQAETLVYDALYLETKTAK